MKFIKASSFLNYDTIPKCQDVGDGDVLVSLEAGEEFLRELESTAATMDYLVCFSHRWDTPEHPDPTGSQCQEAKRRLKTLFPKGKTVTLPTLIHHYDLEATDDGEPGVVHGKAKRKYKQFHNLDLSRVGIFYDYCSLFQKTRTQQQEKVFRNDLKHMHYIYLRGAVLVLSGTSAIQQRPKMKNYLQRAWCFTEYFIATVTESLVIQNDQSKRHAQSRQLRQIRKILEQKRYIHGGGGLLAGLVAERNLFIARVLRKLLSNYT